MTEWHRRHGAKMMEFGGYDMPVEYAGIIQEHEAVRTQVGMFDVSHMAEFIIEGPDAARFLDFMVTNIPSRLAIGQALYTPMCYPNGGTVDDLLIYRQGPSRFFMVVNAANAHKDWEWLLSHAQTFPAVELMNIADETALIAVQGPLSLQVLQPFTDVPLASLPYYHAVFDASIGGFPAHISRTGYTGEDGVELYINQQYALALWEKLAAANIAPVGLGARDTLRLEARLPLYGHELSADISPLEAGLGMFVKLADKTDFIGMDELAAQKAGGPARKVIGLNIEGGIARAGYAVNTESGEAAGYVTSGSYSPTLKRPIALALVSAPLAASGESFTVSIRNRKAAAVRATLPFYRRNKG